VERVEEHDAELMGNQGMEFRIRRDLDAPEEASTNVERPEEQDAELEHPHARGQDVELLRDEAGGRASPDQQRSHKCGAEWVGNDRSHGAVVDFPSMYETKADYGGP
jgi:hypothetical protein